MLGWATASMVFPIRASLAVALNIHLYVLLVTAAAAAFCAFVLPVVSSLNTIVFGSGYLRIPDMAKAGFWLNISSIFFVSLAVFYFLPLVWGVDLMLIPEKFIE